MGGRLLLDASLVANEVVEDVTRRGRHALVSYWFSKRPMTERTRISWTGVLRVRL